MRTLSVVVGVVLMFTGLGQLVWAMNANKARFVLAQGLTLIELGIGVVVAAAMPNGIARTVVVWLGVVGIAASIALQLKVARQHRARP